MKTSIAWRIELTTPPDPSCKWDRTHTVGFIADTLEAAAAQAKAAYPGCTLTSIHKVMKMVVV